MLCQLPAKHAFEMQLDADWRRKHVCANTFVPAESSQRSLPRLLKAQWCMPAKVRACERTCSYSPDRKWLDYQRYQDCSRLCRYVYAQQHLVSLIFRTLLRTKMYRWCIGRSFGARAACAIRCDHSPWRSLSSKLYIAEAAAGQPSRRGSCVVVDTNQTMQQLQAVNCCGLHPHQEFSSRSQLLHQRNFFPQQLTSLRHFRPQQQHNSKQQRQHKLGQSCSTST